MAPQYVAVGGRTSRHRPTPAVRNGRDWELYVLNQLLETLSARHALQTVAAVLLATLRLVPGLIALLLSAPALLVYPFVSETRQRGTLELVDRLIRWTISGDFNTPQDNNSPII